METTIADIGSVRHRLDGSVLIDRAWARQLGAGLAKGARRVGNFYRLPRVEYLRLLEATASSANRPGVHPALRWTSTDDLAVANMLEEATQPQAAEQGASRHDSQCVGCS
ncbi:MAG TPA: hypothetical protein VM754_08730 [Actinomycetota bacterium]|nr:hypothetical protein [Actinomycetota bacterium]